jgi:hypothetical protein
LLTADVVGSVRRSLPGFTADAARLPIG